MADTNNGDAPEVFVGGGKKKRAPRFNLPNKDKRAQLKKPTIILIVFLIFVGVAIAIAVSVDQYNKRKASSNCQTDTNKSSTLSNASLLIGQSDLSNLRTLVGQIKTFCGYAKDPNYQYVIANYYFLASDYPNAKKAYDDMKGVYNPKVGFEPSLVAGQKSIENLKTKIDGLGNEVND